MRAISIFIDDAKTIKRALASKDHEYGAMDLAFVIAVGLYIHDRDRWHSTNAFYGHDAVEWSPGSDETRAVRHRDGYFGVPDSWRNVNVSGVFLVNQLQPCHVHKAEVSAWHHPGSTYLFPASLRIPSDTIKLDADRLTVAESPMGAAEFFGLAEPWPPGEAWPD